ncbi:MAG: 2-hydroxyacyl-CoA dehydratase family protein [Dehalococcoidia bacterium]
METRIQSKAFQELSQAAETLVNPAIQDWKGQGSKVVGYFCSAMPEEVITAAGLLPFRMRATGSTGTDLSDTYFSSINCSFPRHCFNIALQGGFDFLDGVVCMNSCDNVRRIYDNWKRQLPTTLVHIMSLPRKTGEPQVEWFRDEVANLKQLLEKHFDIEITDERLWYAIKLHNETRRLQRKLYDLRKADNPPITGTEALAVTVAGTAMPKERYNQLLRELLDELSESAGNTDYRARLLLMGGIPDDPAYVKVIESQGGLVVTDSLCFGSRLLWNDIDEGASDPIAALAQYYVADRPSCPRMFGDYERRIGLVRDMIRDFKVDGVILERLAFCDHWGFEQLTIENDLKDDNVPCLIMDREYIMSGVGQLRTRVQAFLETMGR